MFLFHWLCTPLYIIFKASIDSGECPSLWKYADITPVNKKGDASQASNYRPISILPAMCRLFERILPDGINYFLYQNRLISAAQYGFVKGRSTEVNDYTALIYGLKQLITNVSSTTCI